MYNIHKFYKPNAYADIVIEIDNKPVAAIHTKYCQLHEAYIVNQAYSNLPKGFGYFMYNLLFRVYEGEYFCPDRNLCLPKAFKVWNRIFHTNDKITPSGFPNKTYTVNPDHKILNLRYRYLSESFPEKELIYTTVDHSEVNDLYFESIEIFLDVYKAEMDYLETLLLSQGSSPVTPICSNPSFDHVLTNACQ